MRKQLGVTNWKQNLLQRQLMKYINSGKSEITCYIWTTVVSKALTMDVVHVDAENSSFETDSSEGEKLVHIALGFFRRKPRCCPCNCSYRLFRIRNKGAIFMIKINSLFASVFMVGSNKLVDFPYPSVQKSVLYWVAVTTCLLAVLPGHWFAEWLLFRQIQNSYCFPISVAAFYHIHGSWCDDLVKHTLCISYCDHGIFRGLF